MFVVLWRLALGGGSASVKRMSWPNLTDLIVDATTDAPVGLVGAPLAAGIGDAGAVRPRPGAAARDAEADRALRCRDRRELASRIADHGDAAIAGMSIEAATAPIRDACAASVARRALTLVAGGNNAVTRPAVHALGAAQPIDQVGLITLDAHFDLREHQRRPRQWQSGARAARGWAAGAQHRASRARAVRQQRGDAPRCVEGGHLVVTIGQVRRDGIAQAISTALAHVAHCRAIVVDCDIDVIDRGQFPGAPGARPGGMAAHDFFAAVRMLAACPAVRLIDLTEWDPPLDPSDLSALTAARWVAECLAGFEQR
jgi:formiminoglutamase